MKSGKGSRVRLVWKVIIGSFLLFFSFLIGAFFLIDRYVQFRKTDRQLQTFFQQHRLSGKVDYYTSGRQIRYVSVGKDSLATLFFIHGSPSSLSIYEPFFADTVLRTHFRMVAPDRPGYGGSGFGNPEPSIEKQAAMLWPLLKSIQHRRQPLIIVAGSYGTSVACQLLIDHPEAADGVVLLAPSLQAGEEKVFWFAPLISSPLISWALPRIFKSANAEKLAHADGLNAMLPGWNRIHIPVFYIQGDNDRLIYPTNANFARHHLTGSPHLDVTFLKDRPHFFIRSDKATIVGKIFECYGYLLGFSMPAGHGDGDSRETVPR